ncbi:hypothetical protein OPV22_035064 [Ensete ventricosum]|uniref:Katanin p80 WD40 repeat-containing subunit B1 homolog n=1 Tax=Ensete ventricosum TaxID=4639 RepID=A0AAV8P0H2_ENSVE|nr:hypothetical protein OPV22_035064 [Ensete ventricosum]
MATTKRAYKLQEFVAHSSSVNCLKIGRKSSRVLVTGGEDNKVNIWAIGKPNAILSLSGHMSAVESVSFDSSEILVAAGAASGSIKLWDLEEAKIVRTLTGHRSNCIAVDFHPFGEFFASGSLDTNLKIWDIRRKGCIHTYKGHSRGVNAIKFTPDGRWVVSGGEDNTVKLWDLTAGKLLHDFKFHEGQIQCIDFHPHEFLLATGSADRTVKFWDLETFELIGSAGPETSGVRSMTFNPDGRTLLCGLHESLKVLSWEPIRSHDAVDVGWSRLSDMNIHEGKLLGCSYNQSCVGVWVVDLSRIEPYAISGSTRSNGNSEPKSTSSGNPSTQTDNNIKSSMGRLSISQSSEANAKETKPEASAASIPGTPQRTGTNAGVKTTTTAPTPVSTTSKRSSSKAQATTNLQTINKSDIIPVIVPRTNPRVELSSDSTKVTGVGRTIPYDIQSKFANFRKVSNIRENSDKADMSIESGLVGNRNTEQNEYLDQTSISSANAVTQLATAGENNQDGVRRNITGRGRLNSFRESTANYDQENCNIKIEKPKEVFPIDVPQRGRTRSIASNWERRERSPSYEGPVSSNSSETMMATSSSYSLRGHNRFAEETVPASDEDSISILLEKHDQFLNLTQSRLIKLQVVSRLWERNDVKGVVGAIEKMSDYSVSSDVLGCLKDKSDLVTLDICTSLLPLLTGLLESNMDRHVGVSLGMLLNLVRIFGPVIHSTLSAGPSVGVDLQAEQRLERCNSCFIELEKVKHRISSMSRRGGSIAKAAQELNLALQDVL